MRYQPGLSVNTFAETRSVPQFSKPGFGFEYADYLNGYFWSREWVNRKAIPDEISGEYPALFLEEGDTVRETELTEIAGVLVDRIECGTCPDADRRTSAKVRANLRIAARSILKHVEEYKLYDRDGSLEWAHPGRAATWGGAPVEVDDLAGYLYLEQTRFAPWGDFPKMEGIRFSVRLQSCETADITYQFDQPTTGDGGIIHCGC